MDLTFVLFAAGGALGGLLMALVLRRTELNFSGGGVLLLLIGWALAGLLAILALSTGAADSVAEGAGLAALLGFPFGPAAVAGIVFGAAGGFVTLWQIGRAQQ